MKRLYILLFCSTLISGSAFAQVGVNTKDPKAALHVKTVDNTIPVLKVDNASKEVLRVEKDGSMGIGGVTTIDRSIHVKADEIRLEGLKDQTSNTQKFNNVVVTDAAGNVEKVPLGIFVTDLPTPKTIKYEAHSFTWDNSQSQQTIEAASTLDMDNSHVRVRFSPVTSGTDAYKYGYIQIQMKEPNFYAMFWEKAGGGFGEHNGSSGDSSNNGDVSRYFNGVSKGYPTASNDGWVNFQTIDTYPSGTSNWDKPSYKADNYNPGNGDIVTALLVLNNSKHFYRLNFVGYYKSGTGSGRMTIFIEQLTGQD